MDLNEAIAHARETAEGKNPNVDRCSECAAQHRQLAEWLEELKVYRATGSTPEEIAAYGKAEMESRLIILPCKPGDVVFAAETSPVIPLQLFDVGVYLRGVDGGDWESLRNFGNTVFLTREDAEAALRRD